MTPHYTAHAEGSVLVSFGETRVLCNVSIQDEVPRWMKEQSVEGGWVTAEYSMLPRSTHTRMRRERHGPSGRTQEIQRLIGRSLRAGLQLDLLGPRSCYVDCDVIQADGGTRTAAITGGYVALILAITPLIEQGSLPAEVVKGNIAAISVGKVQGMNVVDLCYKEDSTADVDMNVVMNSEGDFIELQGTGEQTSFSRADLSDILDLSETACRQLIEVQNQAIAEGNETRLSRE